ncbi:DUF5777 family beta-barrel protein [Parasegetibacter sp. NRK P23]|uniref:DUF5777 family beta-barrel protein n=1 Tax=Parasegetibacter sp. NRK P23 TaxID=2942999 RepID=UPI002043C964|nr:DUF5777 family beta-barrel protein [Parasegetibacter sp. NRK P23]MCM5528113.1 DUF5777 family beta-barrel protein [Parasegetibacter sp. NRK P23]
MQKKVFIAGVLSLFIGTTVNSQDLSELMEAESDSLTKTSTRYASATFKTSRIINGHSVENTASGIFDFKISHRFGMVNEGLYTLFGLDGASFRMGGDFGITNNLTIGVGRSTYEKQYDGLVKLRLLRQSEGAKNMPVTATYVGTMAIQTLKDLRTTNKLRFSDRLYYSHQLLVARKFSENTSLQIMPTVVLYNRVPLVSDPTAFYSLGIGGRQKLSKRISVNGEYYYQFNKLAGTYNSLALGFDIETGGHVFQLHFTNSTGMTERSFITGTTGSWGKGDIHFGFNIARVFRLGGKKDQRSITKG